MQSQLKKLVLLAFTLALALALSHTHTHTLTGEEMQAMLKAHAEAFEGRFQEKQVRS